nr:ABC transporter transmembrane domain-containing protein [uncultured Arsenicibacter sp.]
MLQEVTNQPPTPLQRLIRLLTTEKRDILYVYLYAIIAGLISLSLPLGVQAVFNFVSSGMVFNSIYLLIGLVIIGVILNGLLTVGQMSLVEVLQQRIFAKAAFEFTYRLPRIKEEALEGSNPPELMNRFFDVLTVQKSLPKLLIDITAAALQIVFGVILLSFYHPFFIVFGLLTFLCVAAMVAVLGRKGLETSLKESKFKYKVVAYLEELATDLPAYRREGNCDAAISKMDKLVAGYLENRNDHFRVLKRFFYSTVTFKTFIVGGLLIAGTLLVVERQMTLGQFVAAELVIVLVTGAVEKLIMSIDTVFDLLTAVEKLGSVTDLPIEETEAV